MNMLSADAEISIADVTEPPKDIGTPYESDYLNKQPTRSGGKSVPRTKVESLAQLEQFGNSKLPYGQAGPGTEERVAAKAQTSKRRYPDSIAPSDRHGENIETGIVDGSTDN